MFFFSDFFRIFSKKIFRLLAKKLQDVQDVFKTTFYVSRGTVCGFFCKKFWLVFDFLQKPLWWFSKFYLHVQSKNCGRNSFFCFSVQNLSRILSKKFFRLLAKKLQEVFKSTFCVSRGTICGLNFFKNFEPFWIFCRNP